MKAKRSDNILARYRSREWQPNREKLEWRKALPGSPQEVFPLLCPSREADWIPGWDAELISTETGYAELGCIFRTDPSGTVGPGVWVFTRHEAPSLVELVRFTPDLLFQLRISLEEEAASKTAVRWEFVLTALTETGDGQVDEAAEGIAERGEMLTAALEHYLRTGRMIELGG
jgi:hypothetical protein